MFRAMSYVNPGKEINVLAAAIFYYEKKLQPALTHLAKTSYFSTSALEKIRDSALDAAVKKIVAPNGNSARVADALDIYSKSRVNIE